ncbi:glycosyltransferase family 2 protein [Salinibius halmophilus]|uniref:glycosyltransferase family 2 protein n=1 Tax=Salinibius halmophilus TaxID=1853216 RepID=UPI000E676665|nr:glycosyltransferase family 2 protein [Salinibius halmophilus]
MITALNAVTLTLIFICLYVYLGYPVLLYFFSKIFNRKTNYDVNHRPSVTLIVSAFNEEEVIGSKIKNSIKLNYPKDLLEVIVVSDGSTDKTDEIVSSFNEKNIKLFRQEGRLGKTLGLNSALEIAKGEIIVFSDANAIYDLNAIKNIVPHFNDPKVGYVVGAALYNDDDSSSASESIYWNYELLIKKWESQLHSVVGGDGAIYAIRKDLWTPLNQHDINDFVNPLQIVSKGYRGIFEEKAKCFENTAGNLSLEFNRKKRIVGRSFRGLLSVATVLNPLKHGIFSIQVISHKLLRWLVPFFLISISLINISMSIIGLNYYLLASTAEIIAYIICLACIITKEKYKALCIPYYFVLVNIASLLGVISAAFGKTEATWKTARDTKRDSKSHIKPSIIMLAVITLKIATVYIGINNV